MPYDRLAEMLRWLEEKGLIKVNEYGTRKEVEITKEGLKALDDLAKCLRYSKDWDLNKWASGHNRLGKSANTGMLSSGAGLIDDESDFG